MPQLADGNKVIAEAASQTGPTCQTIQLLIRLSAAELGEQLIEQRDYSDQQLQG